MIGSDITHWKSDSQLHAQSEQSTRHTSPAPWAPALRRQICAEPMTGAPQQPR
ncbi:hypothetical protein PAXINDRAFT_8197 [Paxillus involutus ATCC 200175]|nr:hypothetical protein PAXINDRAFT_8197 [Paxillus involutus ATCC 200175]